MDAVARTAGGTNYVKWGHSQPGHHQALSPTADMQGYGPQVDCVLASRDGLLLSIEQIRDICTYVLGPAVQVVTGGGYVKATGNTKSTIHCLYIINGGAQFTKTDKLRLIAALEASAHFTPAQSSHRTIRVTDSYGHELELVPDNYSDTENHAHHPVLTVPPVQDTVAALKAINHSRGLELTTWHIERLVIAANHRVPSSLGGDRTLVRQFLLATAISMITQDSGSAAEGALGFPSDGAVDKAHQRAAAIGLETHLRRAIESGRLMADEGWARFALNR
ncbi:unnamed protein product [Vitrella brassicaformis CCMP3155]|uniref:Uncharacterized protein n=1 Tax=Vitrella brassicaformis (strain CCMP3155) TaxID=1169540 RepID=A0A0G4GRX8_VITBC|nr:unnamed protein product [Vitrella brassicaformis CCMP3155]|mmetsp:Transcript_6221/g.17893  ORF Transcript_6221/g.17893 Transcript_6221/m.17893 type:complete len:278 (+) Transcript_6221:105-938(+)|eukprot:CEM33369.1 unnamed protein product [Vitrella brassicaformis CCMP3155]